MTIRYKPSIFFIFLVVSTASLADQSKKGLPVAWENIIVNQGKFEKKRIQIDGIIRVLVSGVNSYEFRLYLDRESLENDRDFRFIDLDPERFVKDLGNINVTGLRLIQELNGKYAVLKGEFHAYNLNSEENLATGQYGIGKLTGPYYCSIKK